MLALLAVLIVPQGSVSAATTPPCPSGPRPLNPCPGWEWVTFLGGQGKESAYAIAADSAGNVYVAGTSSSVDFPTAPGAFDASYNGGNPRFVAGGDDIFVVKLNANGSGLAYATLLGGSGVEMVSDIAVDSAGDVYVTGWTESRDFPTTPDAYDASYSGRGGISEICEGSSCSSWGGDAFVTKLNSAGSALIYSTFLGGSGTDWAQAIDVDASGNAYVTGFTISQYNDNDFPTTPGAFDRITEVHYMDAFVAKLDAAGSVLVYSTFLGGSSFDQGFDIAVDLKGNAYLTGATDSIDFPVTIGAFGETISGDWDGFVAKLNEAGSALVYSTYLGGNGWDVGWSIAVDSEGNAYVAGETPSPDFPTTSDVFDSTFNGGVDAFVTKLSATGSTLVYSTFVGGRGNDEGYSIAVDSAGNAFMTGWTESADFPATAGAYDKTFNGKVDGFVTRLSTTGYAIIDSTFLGGSDRDWGSSIAIDSDGNAGIAGLTFSDNLPTTYDSYDPGLSGGWDAFVSKLEFFPHPDRPPRASFTLSPLAGEVNTTFTVDASSSLDTEDLSSALQVRWDWKSDGVWDTEWSTMKQAQIQFATSGEYAIRLEVKDSGGLTGAATRIVSVRGTVIPVTVIPPLFVEAAVDTSGGTVPFTASFRATPSGGAPPYSFLWDFGDGSASALPNPSHTYQAPGTYTATLTLTDSEGHTTTSDVQITVNPSVAGGPGSEILSGILYAAVALSLGGAGILLWARRQRARRPPPGT